MNMDKTYEQLKELNLSLMAEILKNKLHNADHIDISTEQFISIVIEDFYLSKKQRRLQRLISTARFKPELPSFEDIIYNTNRGFKKNDIMNFSTLRWIEDTQNIIFTGPTGCGKNFLAQAIALQACRMGVNTLNMRFNLLFEEINAAKATGTYLQYLKKLSKIKVLIIDDFLMHEISTQDLSILMDIVEEKQQLGSIIITTQYPIALWHKKMPDPTVGAAICDRLVHTAYKFNLKGDSMRKKIQNPK